MTLPKSLTTVTPFSKFLAMVFFILLPFIGFFFGMAYQQKINSSPTQLTLVQPSNPSPTPTPIIDSTANWKTYTDSKYGVSIQYPSDWTFSTKNNMNQTDDKLIFSIKNDEQGDVALYKNLITGFCEGPGKIVTSAVIFNNGSKGNRVGCPRTITINYIEGGNDFWLVAKALNDDSMSIFNQILSTFKFTK